MDFGYGDLDPSVVGWGVHRATLFDLLWGALERAGIRVRAGTGVERLERSADGWRIRAADGSVLGPYRLVVGADGARSRVRRLSGLCRKDVGYPYGALWSVIPDPDGLAADVLTQRYRDTRVTLGVLPTGVRSASIFWSVASRDLDRALAAGPEAFIRSAAPFAGPWLPLLERVRDVGIVGARYRDVVTPRPALGRGSAGLVLIGDAAHAMSPQLGLGASLALADAWSLASALRAHPEELDVALERHIRDRGAQVRWYTWLSRLMTPVFQSDLVPVGWARDLLLEPVARIPWVRRQFVLTLMGSRTSPFTEWHPT
jgi:2-polyprenyl-6-methoxyphenol hydroxylase-like FAD-dependent oxidoreductase